MREAQRVLLHVVEVDRRSRSQREVTVVVGLTSRAVSAINFRFRNLMCAIASFVTPQALTCLGDRVWCDMLEV